MYTNIVNIPDSILFLTSCRLAIKESVLANEDLEHYTALGLADYVMNEATDYQIMSIVVDDEYVEEKYNFESELALFDRYKEMVVENIHDFAFLESHDLKSLLYEVGPVSQEGISSATPILEFLYESGMLQEKGKWSAAKQKVADAAAAAKQKASDAAFDAQFKGRALKKSVPHRAKGMAKTGKEAIGKVVDTVKGKVKAVPGQVKDAAGKVKDAASNAAFDAQFKARALKKSIPHKAKGMYKGGKEAVGKALATKAGKVGAVALAAAAIYGGVKAYQRFMSQAARACGGMSGATKTDCMKKYKVNALKGQINATQQGMASCAKAKDPAKCKASIQARVQKLQAKAAKAAA
jgi:uncharacterized protein YjbJ (UPF0337 family)